MESEAAGLEMEAAFTLGRLVEIDEKEEVAVSYDDLVSQVTRGECARIT